MTNLVSRLRAALSRPLPGLEAQLRMAPSPRLGWDPLKFPEGAANGAALLLVYPHDDTLHLALTVRGSGLRNHTGQVSLPGGRVEEGETFEAAALREAQEEIGLDAKFIEPIGYLDLYLTFSGFRILPLVARVDPGYRITLNPAEVADAFEVPLEFVMQPANHQRHKRDWKGIERQYYAMPFGDRYIWGVTAGILRNLYERIYAV